jgi:lysophospholipase L1-like esterase
LSFLIRRPAARVLAVAACAASVFAVSAGSAAAKFAGSGHVTPGSRYLALGDSVSFGYQEAAVVPAPDYTNAKNFVGFPERLGSILHLKVTNVSCPGETSASLIDVKAQSNGCENKVTPGSNTPSPGGYRTQFPLHTKYSGSQLAEAIRFLNRHKDTQLVTLMIGANDFFACQVITADHCTAPAEQAAVLKQIGANVKKILNGVRNTAHYRHQIAIVNYYSLDYSSAATNALSNALNQAVDTAAKPYNVRFADGFGELQKASTIFGGKTCIAGLLTDLGTPGTCGVHPSYAGQTLLASAVSTAVRH